MHYAKPRTPALVAQKELVELRPRKLPPVHRVEPLPALVVGILVLGVAEQALLQLLQEELHRFAVHGLLRQGVVAVRQAEKRPLHRVRRPEVRRRGELFVVQMSPVA